MNLKHEGWEVGIGTDDRYIHIRHEDGKGFIEIAVTSDGFSVHIFNDKNKSVASTFADYDDLNV